MGCGSQCAKYFLCFFNFIFFVAGGAALAVGIWLLADRNSFANLIAQVDQADILNKTDAHIIKMIAYILIVAGALTFVVSFLGYCGAMFESRCLLFVYGVLLVLILLLQCVAVALAFGLRADAEQGTKDFLKSTIKYYASSNNAETITVMWDGIMSQLHCCGVESHLDFRDSSNWTSSGTMVVPEACCVKENGYLKDSNCPANPDSSNSHYEMGCYKALVTLLKDNAAIAIGVAVALALVEILVIILALYLACCYWRPQHVLTCWCCC